MKRSLVMNPFYHLAIDVLILALQLLSGLGNGFILLLFQRSSRLRKNHSLRLVLVLALSDLLFALCSLPYLLHYLIFWSAQLLNYDGRLVVWLSAPLSVQMKLNLVIAAAIALDRLQAMRWPLHYRGKSQCQFAVAAVTLGLCLGAVDVLLQNWLDPLREVPGCAAVGCFLSRQFRLYWGTSNMALNALMLVLTLWVYFEFNKLRLRSIAIAGVPANGQANEREQRNFQQTNRLSLGILAISVLFLLIPSSLVGLSDLAGLNMFTAIGPFYIVGLLLAGAANSVVYIWLHVELRAAAKAVLLGERESEESAEEQARTRDNITRSSRWQPPTQPNGQ